MGLMVGSRLVTDLFVKAGTFTAHQMLPGGTYMIVTIYEAGSLRPGQPKIGVEPFFNSWIPKNKGLALMSADFCFWEQKKSCHTSHVQLGTTGNYVPFSNARRVPLLLFRFEADCNK